MEKQDIINFAWPLIKQESGTAIMWTLIGAGAGLLSSIVLIKILWMFFKNKNFLGGKKGPKWPRSLLLVSWILLIPLSCITSGGAWGLVTAVYKILEKQEAIEEAVSLTVEQPINETFIEFLDSPNFSPQQKALLLRQQGDKITISTFELDKWLIYTEDALYEMIKEHIFDFFPDSEAPKKDSSISLQQGIERWIINSFLKEHNPASLAKEGRVVIKHAEGKFGTRVSSKELGYSIGAILVKPHTDKLVKDFKKSILITGFIQLAIIIIISVAIAALLTVLARKIHKKNSET